MIWKFGQTPLDRFLRWINLLRKVKKMSDCHHNPPCSTAQRAINHPEEPKNLTEEEFVQRLKDAGWTEIQAREEFRSIQEDDESGYDGP
jgi:predicted Ser/Thr protein kinase